MLKLILISLIGIFVFYSFISLGKYYYKFMNAHDGTYNNRLKAFIKNKTSIYYFIRSVYGSVIFFIAMIL
ncbi:hypothetical protein [Brachyspira pilosicoli]|uniref:hypothetical protein n=1 Tax=Brachyspira pilosicoli TaxID=52584 RepID=UPI0012F48E57|nr:hypothetical protein [Brachyspira pilosicoli]